MRMKVAVMETPTGGTICGVETPLGPCTMKKGHSVEWHRHLVHETVKWTIYDESGEEKLLKGTGKIPLQYALAEAFEDRTNIIIYASKVSPTNSTNQADGQATG